jgi:hypothetical protein
MGIGGLVSFTQQGGGSMSLVQYVSTICRTGAWNRAKAGMTASEPAASLILEPLLQLHANRWWTGRMGSGNRTTASPTLPRFISLALHQRQSSLSREINSGHSIPSASALPISAHYCTCNVLVWSSTWANAGVVITIGSTPCGEERPEDRIGSRSSEASFSILLTVDCVRPCPWIYGVAPPLSLPTVLWNAEDQQILWTKIIWRVATSVTGRCHSRWHVSMWFLPSLLVRGQFLGEIYHSLYSTVCIPGSTDCWRKPCNLFAWVCCKCFR